MANFMATGNLVSPSGLDLQQTSGFTIVAEKLNWQRYISHFRSIHRGAFFAELKTTTVRKLLPEAWGMIYAIFEIYNLIAVLKASSAPSTLQMAPLVVFSIISRALVVLSLPPSLSPTSLVCSLHTV